MSADPARPIRGVLAPGTMVDHFRVMRLLGRGGMGHVYLARDTALGRKVALKLVSPDRVGSAETLARLRREAAATARFNHPHIVTLYSVGEHDGVPYVALEYLEGQTLGERTRDGRPPLRDALQIAHAVASALREAHRHGIVHRDLKPGNVVIARDGRPRVLDFGLATFLAGSVDDDGEPRPGGPDGGERLGTPRYMAPEQWAAAEPTGATDVWAFGVILYQLLCGRHPYGGASGADLRALITGADPVPPPSPPPRGTPTAVIDLVAACLAKQPAKRPSAADLVETLERVLQRRADRGPESASPFRGLLPFTERHAHLFFGREEETAQFLERLRERPVLPIVGPSGAGKSSFMLAAVLPRLREQGDWVILTARPGADPFATLAHRLVAGEHATGSARTPSPDADSETQPTVSLLPQPPAPRSRRDLGAEAATLAAELAARPHALSLRLRAWAEAESARILLFIDPLEELYAGDVGADVRAAFLASLCAAADDRDDPIRVCFALRDDFLGRLAEDGVPAQVLEQLVVLGTPGPAALREIITAPLALDGYRFDDEALVDEMVEAVRGEPAGLPLLQFTARQLWHRRDRKRRLLQRAAYVEIGGVIGALAAHADGVLAGQSPADEKLVRELLLRLVTGEGTRRALPEPALLDGLGDGAPRVLERLVEARLLTVRRGFSADGAAAIELAHEALVRRWDRLARWIDESREEIVFLDQIGHAAERWERRGRRDVDLWQGDPLAEAGRILARAEARAPAPVIAFHAAGERAARRARRRRRLLAAALVGALAAVAVGALVAALLIADRERDARRRGAEAEREAARAALLAGDLLQARARLRASLEAQDTPHARALWAALAHQPLTWDTTIGGSVYDVAFSPDGAVIAAVGQDGAARLLDRASSRARVLRWSGDQLFSAAFSPDGRTLAGGSWRGPVVLWDLTNGDARELAGHASQVAAVRFSPDGARLVSGGDDGTLRIWDVAAGRPERVVGQTAAIADVDVSPDGKLVATASWDGSVRLWGLADGVSHGELRGHQGPVAAVRFVDAGRLVSGGWDGTLRLWTIDAGGGDGAPPPRLLGAHGAQISSIAVDAGADLVASSGLDGTLRLWRLSDGRALARLEAHRGDANAIAIAPAGGAVVSGGIDHHVELWDAALAAAARDEIGHRMTAVAVDVSPDGALLVTAGYDETLRVWEAASGRQVAVLRGHRGRIWSAKFLADSAAAEPRVVSVGADATVRVWNLATGVAEHVMVGHTSEVVDVAVAGDGRTVVSGSSDGTIRLWDAATGDLTRTIASHPAAVEGVAITGDGALLASGGADATVRLFDAATGEPRGVLRGHTATVPGVWFSPDKARLASCGNDGELRLWDVATGTGQVLSRGDRLYRVRFSADGTRLGIAGADGVARVWPMAVASGASTPPGLFRAPPALLAGHRGEVNEVAFADDGSVATVGNDGTVRRWDAATGAPLWRVPLLDEAALAMVSHRGWEPLVAGTPLPDRSSAAWRAAAASLRADVAPDGRSLCLLTAGEDLERWDLAADARSFGVATMDVHALVALADGCAAIAGSEARRWSADGAADRLALDAGAIARDGDGLLVAAGRQVIALGPDGGERSRQPADIGVTAVARVGADLLVGYQDGNAELRAPPPSGRVLPLDDVSASAVVAARAGPAGAVILGFADGTVGLWDGATGARLQSAHLHGAALYLVERGGTLHAVSELGDHAALDVTAFEAPYCELLRRVWRSVPVVWVAGRSIPRPPPAGHRCAR